MSDELDPVIHQAIDEKLRIDEFPEFFPGARINFAENMLCRRQNGIAVIDMREDNLNSPERYSWNELCELVRRYSSALRYSSAKKGDIVARTWLNIQASALGILR